MRALTAPPRARLTESGEDEVIEQRQEGRGVRPAFPATGLGHQAEFLKF